MSYSFFSLQIWPNITSPKKSISGHSVLEDFSVPITVIPSPAHFYSLHLALPEITSCLFIGRLYVTLEWQCCKGVPFGPSTVPAFGWKFYKYPKALVCTDLFLDHELWWRKKQWQNLYKYDHYQKWKVWQNQCWQLPKIPHTWKEVILVRKSWEIGFFYVLKTCLFCSYFWKKTQ